MKATLTLDRTFVATTQWLRQETRIRPAFWISRLSFSSRMGFFMSLATCDPCEILYATMHCTLIPPQKKKQMSSPLFVQETKMPLKVLCQVGCVQQQSSSAWGVAGGTNNHNHTVSTAQYSNSYAYSARYACDAFPLSFAFFVFLSFENRNECYEMTMSGGLFSQSSCIWATLSALW